jgi:hypothetical protein
MKDYSLSRRRLALEVVVLATVAMVALLAGYAYQVMASPAEMPDQMPGQMPEAALYAVSWNTAVITEDTTSTAYLTQGYCYHDIFCDIDFLDSQTITVKVQSSPDNSTWYDTYTFVSSGSADSTTFTRCMSYGRYERVDFDVESSNEVTPVCKSVFFNNWAPYGYVEPKE